MLGVAYVTPAPRRFARSRPPQLYAWQPQLASHWPGLSPAFLAVLALWSLGMILARRTGLSTVVCHRVPLLGQSDNTVRQRLREFYQEAPAKAGRHRQDFDPADCFAPLLAWVVALWPSRRLALALDGTNLGDRFHILTASVVDGGIGIPVAWKVLRGNQTEAWHPHWCALLQWLRSALDADWTVVVLTDRGLESARLFTALVGVGWHPLMRVKAAGTFRPRGWKNWYRFGQLVPRVGQRFTAVGVAYKSADEALACTLLGGWEAGHDAPWLLLTDRPPTAASPLWYGFRSWIEQQFKMLKGGLWHWQHTRRTDPGRVERLWLAVAVTLWWLVVLGAAVERDACRETVGEIRRPRTAAGRVHRLLGLGLAAWLAALAQGRALPLPVGKLPEESWPETWHAVPSLTEAEFLLGPTYP
jgi:hypothetical protein